MSAVTTPPPVRPLPSHKQSMKDLHIKTNAYNGHYVWPVSVYVCCCKWNFGTVVLVMRCVGFSYVARRLNVCAHNLLYGLISARKWLFTYWLHCSKTLILTSARTIFFSATSGHLKMGVHT